MAYVQINRKLIDGATYLITNDYEKALLETKTGWSDAEVLSRVAARRDVAVEPICSHATRHYARTYLQLDSRATSADDLLEDLGYVHHCEDCLRRTHERELIAHPPETCDACGGTRILTAGPIYLGAVADPEFARTTREHVTDGMGEAARARRLLDTVAAELDTPTHYDQHRLCKQWSRSAVGMEEFVDALRDAGYEATRAHYSGTAFKTDATVTEIRDATAE